MNAQATWVRRRMSVLRDMARWRPRGKTGMASPSGARQNSEIVEGVGEELDRQIAPCLFRGKREQCQATSARPRRLP